VATLPDPLPRVLAPLVADLRATLGPELVGAYLYGSAIAGGFEPDVSDLDVVVVTERPIDETPVGTFQGVIDRLMAREPDWADRLDVSFVDRGTLAAFASGGALLSISHDEPLARYDDADDWLPTWFLVRSADAPLAGPPPAELIPPIETSAFIAHVVAGAAGLIARLSADGRPSARAYLVLTLGRVLRTTDTGRPCSKLDGAAWIVDNRPDAARVVEACLATWRSRGHVPFSARIEAELPTLIAALGDAIRRRRAASGFADSSEGAGESTKGAD